MPVNLSSRTNKKFSQFPKRCFCLRRLCLDNLPLLSCFSFTFQRKWDLRFKVTQYISKPLRWFRCSRFGYVTKHIQGECPMLELWKRKPLVMLWLLWQNIPQLQRKTLCPHYKMESEFIKIRTVSKICWDLSKNTRVQRLLWLLRHWQDFLRYQV